MALFGIKRIQYCKATQLAFSGQNNPFLGIASEPTNTFTDVVCMINSRATLTIEQAVVNKQIVYTAKLQFVTPADPMLDVDHYAFIATTNEGERILLGANTRPQVAVVTAQGVFGNAGELTAYTTTAEFKADYRPLRLPVTAVEPISGPAYDICCGQIPQPTAPDTREFDICCGEIVGEAEPTLLTVVWLNGDGSVLDTKNYYSNQPEPTTTAVPTKAATSEYSYTFDHWQVLSNVGNVKTYEPIFTAVPLTILVYFTYSGSGPMKYAYKNAEGSTTVETEAYSGISDWWPLYFNERLLAEHYFKFKDTEECTYLTADWTAFNAAFPQMHPIYHPNNPNFQIGYYSDDWQGSI